METVYVAQFDLLSPHQQVLSFKKGDRFIPLSPKSNNPNWTFGVSSTGKIGYLPCTYVKQQPVSKDELTGFIDLVLETLETQCSGSYTKLQRDVIQELTTWRTLLLSPMHSPEDAAVAILMKQREVEIIPQPVIPKVEHKVEPIVKKEPQQKLKEIVQEEPSPDKISLAHLAAVETQTEPVIAQPVECAKCVLRRDTVRKNVQTQFSEVVPTSDKSTETAEEKVVKKPSFTMMNGLADTLDESTISDVPVWLIPSLIENVRHETQLSHQKCKVALAVVLDTLSNAVPNVAGLWDQLKQNLDRFEIIQEEVENVVISEDRKRLFHIFKQLWYCKNDEQQRSWPVHEDEDLIASLLKDLNSILMDADPKVSKEIVQREDYELVNLLVTYYQMETRRLLRLKMLYVFVTLCELDIVVVSQLLLSILPMELARDMQCTYEDSEKLQHSAFLLTIIFSTGQKPPNAIYEFIDRKFLNFLFENVEIALRSGDDDIGNHLLNILLAFNLHFDDINHNHVFDCLKDRDDARMLTERLIFYVNREDDPVDILVCKAESPNSVLKFLVDFFTFHDLVQLFYLNDIKLLLDIVVRQLTDYHSGDSKRMWYLELARNIIRNSSYSEHFHQQADLEKCFYTIMAQEDPCFRESGFVQEILLEFADWFSVEW